MKIKILLILFLISMEVISQNSFRLKIIDFETKENIEGASVYVEELAALDKKTDINGFVFYTNLPSDRKVRINIRKAGYIAIQIEVLASVKAKPDNNKTIELKKEPIQDENITIWGEVTDFDGLDLQEASVEVKYIGHSVETKTDKSGNYKIIVDRKIFESSKLYSIEIDHPKCQKQRYDEIIPKTYHIKKDFTLNCKVEKISNNTQSNNITAKDLIGVWVCQNNEYGIENTIVFHVYANGVTYYEFYDANRQLIGNRIGGRWQYAEGMLYEIFENGNTGKAEIKWINSNNFILKIIDNGNPDTKNIERYYRKLR